ncbi:MAG: nuclear transport factor 2 family protein [Acidobacteria bacterium]|nr:nuclear transport factor 2 family protein [Acidobacteriota bacterium]
MFFPRVLLLTAAVCLAQPPSKNDILALDKKWSDAIQKKDAATLDKLLTDNLVYAHASGVVDTKKTYIAKIKEGKQVYKSFEQRSPSVAVYGNDTAISFSWVHVTGTNPQGPFDDKIMMLHTWVKQGGAWKLAAHQTTRVDKLP